MQGKYDDCCDAIAFNSVNAKRKADVFKFLPFELRKALFSRRINVDGRPNRSNKAAFPNFSGVYSVDVSLWNLISLKFREFNLLYIRLTAFWGSFVLTLF